MKKKIRLTYFIIFFSVLALMSLPKNSIEKLRNGSVSLYTALSSPVLSIKNFFSSSPTSVDSVSSEEFQRLSLENILLKQELEMIQETFRQEIKILKQNTFSNNSSAVNDKLLSLHKLLSWRLQAIPARVIFRSTSSWSSSLWVNVGEHTNEALGKKVITKNSPVVVGSAVVGVVDFVGKSQSRIRLITDSGLTPSVRVARGGTQNNLAADKMDEMIHYLSGIDSFEEQKDLIFNLKKAKNKFSQSQPTAYLAKGELHGMSHPLWRSNNNLLKGIGFNYDFSDEEGPARDLRSGKPLDPQSKDLATPIIRNKDLLVTSGLDGVFPAGLLVAEVTRIFPLKEGDYYYEIEARPIAGSLDDLTLVLILPSIGYDPSEKPAPYSDLLNSAP